MSTSAGNVAIVAMDLTLDGEAITYLSGGSPAKVVPRSPWVVCRFGYLSPQCLAKASAVNVAIVAMDLEAITYLSGGRSPVEADTASSFFGGGLRLIQHRA